ARLVGYTSLMLRDKNLVPLSHHHQHALAMCVRLNRVLETDDLDADAWQAEIARQFDQEIGFHFAAEEKEGFQRAAQFAELRDLIQELLGEHEALRGLFRRAAARELDLLGLAELEQKLSGHVRKEERQLFEGIQARMTPEEMTAMGSALE